MTIEAKLIDLICHQISRPASPAIHALTDRLLAHYGNAIEAILFYGSCLRTGEDRGGLVDLYVLVDRYRAIEPRRLLAALNKMLPPNVFYLEMPYEDRIVRAKYAVLSLKDFIKGTSWHGFHSYFWGRFAQPVGLLYTRNDKIAQRVQAALARAVVTFIARVLPRVPSPFTARELWTRGLSLCYRAELRAERPQKLILIFESAPDYFEHITQIALNMRLFHVNIQATQAGCLYTTTIVDRTRRISHMEWMVRSWQGKLLSVLRLLKGALTFRGGVDYILWKIESHSGVKIEVPPRLRRFPFLATCVIFWKLYRQGAYR